MWKKELEVARKLAVQAGNAILEIYDGAGDVQVEVAISPDVTAPVEIGQTVGAVTLTLDGQTVSQYSILTADCAEAITFGNVYELFWQGLTG